MSNTVKQFADNQSGYYRSWLWKSCDCDTPIEVNAFLDLVTKKARCVPDRCPACGQPFHVEVEPCDPPAP